MADTQAKLDTNICPIVCALNGAYAADTLPLPGADPAHLFADTRTEWPTYRSNGSTDHGTNFISNTPYPQANASTVRPAYRPAFERSDC